MMPFPDYGIALPIANPLPGVDDGRSGLNGDLVGDPAASPIRSHSVSAVVSGTAGIDTDPLQSVYPDKYIDRSIHD